MRIQHILDLNVGHVGGEVQWNISLVLSWAPAVVGDKHCLVCPKRLVVAKSRIRETKSNLEWPKIKCRINIILRYLSG